MQESCIVIADIDYNIASPLIHLHLQIGITQNVIWWLPGWNGNLFWLKAQPFQIPKFFKIKVIFDTKSQSGYAFYRENQSWGPHYTTFSQKSTNRNLFFKKIFKLFVAYGKVPWAWKVEGSQQKGFCFALRCCVKDWCAKVICQRFAKTRTRMIEKGPQGCFNGVLSIYRWLWHLLNDESRGMKSALITPSRLQSLVPESCTVLQSFSGSKGTHFHIKRGASRLFFFEFL